MQSFKQLVRKIKQDTYAIYLASIDPRVPWYTRLLAVCLVAYAFSPIDLIIFLWFLLGMVAVIWVKHIFNI